MTFIDGLNRHDMDEWAACLSSDFTADYPSAKGLNAAYARGFNESFFPAFPDLHFDVERVLADGDVVVIAWTATGTHLGALEGPNGAVIPPTGKKGVVNGVLISEVRDGKIVRERTYWNLLDLLTQLGVA
jgi:steroid delta-isomerase-like uncharacterized protein